MVGSIHVANTILIKLKKDKIWITPNKLHCLLYLLYSHYLYSYGVNLFNEPFCIDEGYPKVPSISFKFDSYGSDVIESCAYDVNNKLFCINNNNYHFNRSLKNILKKFKIYSEIELLSYIKKDGNLINNYGIGEVIKNDDILNDEVNRNQKVNMKVLRKKL